MAPPTHCRGFKPQPSLSHSYALRSLGSNTVAQIILGEVKISFRRWLTEDVTTCWDHIWNATISFQLQEDKDRIIWRFEKNKRFSVKSLYNALTSNDDGQSFRIIWKGKAPYKIKIFMWLVANGAILTKDNLLKRKWQGGPACYFCNGNKTIPHLFFSCPTATVIWAIVAKCFGANNIPRNLSVGNGVSLVIRGKNFHVWGVAAIC